MAFFIILMNTFLTLPVRVPGYW